MSDDMVQARELAAMEQRAVAAKERLAAAERVIAGTAYPSDAGLTREQAFHGWEVANRQRDQWSDRALAAEAAAGRLREALVGAEASLSDAMISVTDLHGPAGWAEYRKHHWWIKAMESMRAARAALTKGTDHE